MPETMWHISCLAPHQKWLTGAEGTAEDSIRVEGSNETCGSLRSPGSCGSLVACKWTCACCNQVKPCRRIVTPFAGCDSKWLVPAAFVGFSSGVLKAGRVTFWFHVLFQALARTVDMVLLFDAGSSSASRVYLPFGQRPPSGCCRSSTASPPAYHGS